MAEAKNDKSDVSKEIKSLSEGQKQTYDKLVAMKLANVTQEQLIKAAQEFGVDVDAAAAYLAVDDPDGGNDDPIAEPNFLTSLSHSKKIESVDKKQIPDDLKQKNGPSSDK